MNSNETRSVGPDLYIIVRSSISGGVVHYCVSEIVDVLIAQN